MKRAWSRLKNHSFDIKFIHTDIQYMQSVNRHQKFCFALCEAVLICVLWNISKSCNLTFVCNAVLTLADKTHISGLRPLVTLSCSYDHIRSSSWRMSSQNYGFHIIMRSNLIAAPESSTSLTSTSAHGHDLEPAVPISIHEIYFPSIHENVALPSHYQSSGFLSGFHTKTPRTVYIPLDKGSVPRLRFTGLTKVAVLQYLRSYSLRNTLNRPPTSYT